MLEIGKGTKLKDKTVHENTIYIYIYVNIYRYTNEMM